MELNSVMQQKVNQMVGDMHGISNLETCIALAAELVREGWGKADKEFSASQTECMSFGKALEALKSGNRVARKGWNGKGIYLELQRPDKYSKMSLPYIYIVTNSLVSDNPDAPRGIVPWLASQTDMLCEDWVIV